MAGAILVIQWSSDPGGLLDAGGADPLLSAAVAFTLCAGLRLAAIRWNLSLPPYGGGRMS